MDNFMCRWGREEGETNHNMNMCRTVRMSVHETQKLPRRTIVRNGIRCRLQTVPAVFAVVSRNELASQIVVRLFLVLLFV